MPKRRRTRSYYRNLIYINGRWIEADLVNDVKRTVYREDVTYVSNSTGIYCYDGYGTLKVNDTTPEMINRWLWTYDNSKDYK